MEEATQIFSKKNVIAVILLLALAIAIPVGINLLQKQQQLRSKATEDAIKFTGTGVTKDASGKYTSTSEEVTVELRSPIGPPPPTP